jgi:hypothetical protein
MREPDVIESGLFGQDRQADQFMGITEVTDQSQTKFHGTSFPFFKRHSNGPQNSAKITPCKIEKP